jgi:hypothetical protein
VLYAVLQQQVLDVPGLLDGQTTALPVDEQLHAKVLQLVSDLGVDLLVDAAEVGQQRVDGALLSGGDEQIVHVDAHRALVAVRVHEVEDALVLLALREAEPDEGRRDVLEPQEGRLHQAVQGLVQLHDEGAVWRHELLALRIDS